jgi:putative phosphoesterase
MLIGLLSDTHIPDHAKKLPEQLPEIFWNVELILHAGDIYSLTVLDDLEKIAPVFAALGDDDYSTTINDRRVKAKHIIKKEGVNIWLMHHMPEKLPKVSKEIPWLDEPPDVIVYGHTHRSAIDENDGILKINPGSPTFPDYKVRPGPVAILEISDGKVEAKIIQLS